MSCEVFSPLLLRTLADINHHLVMSPHKRNLAAAAAPAAVQDPQPLKGKRARSTRALQMEEAELCPRAAVANGTQHEKADGSSSSSSNGVNSSSSISITKSPEGGLKEPTAKRRRSSTASSRRSSISVPTDERPESRLCTFICLVVYSSYLNGRIWVYTRLFL